MCLKFDSYLFVLDLKCGGILTSRKGMFATPNYPMVYPANLTCLWVIKVPSASAIVVQFMKFISIGNSPDCQDDYLVSFEDGRYPSKSGPLIECGVKIDNKYFLGSEVWIEFNSGMLDRGYGFQAFYDAWFDSVNAKTAIPGIYFSVLLSRQCMTAFGA